jgi:hypothetical protein
MAQASQFESSFRYFSCVALVVVRTINTTHTKTETHNCLNREFNKTIGDVSMVGSLRLTVGLVVVLVALLAVVFLFRKKRSDKENTLVTLGAMFVVLGIVFGDDRLVGYSFIGLGVLLSIASVVGRRNETRI